MRGVGVVIELCVCIGGSDRSSHSGACERTCAGPLVIVFVARRRGHACSPARRVYLCIALQAAAAAAQRRVQAGLRTEIEKREREKE